MRPIRNIKKCRPEQGEACAPQHTPAIFFFIKLHPQKSPMTHFRYTQKSLLRLIGPYSRSVFPYMDLFWSIIYIYMYIFYLLLFTCAPTPKQIEELKPWKSELIYAILRHPEILFYTLLCQIYFRRTIPELVKLEPDTCPSWFAFFLGPVFQAGEKVHKSRLERSSEVPSPLGPGDLGAGWVPTSTSYLWNLGALRKIPSACFGCWNPHLAQTSP